MTLRDSLYWPGLYRDSHNLATPESIAHPAKMSYPLLFRILGHMREIGLLAEGDTVLDFMAGTGRTAVAAGALDYPAITVELEDRFVAHQTGWDCDGQAAGWCVETDTHAAHRVVGMKEYAERRLHRELDWAILQGDARNLSELLAERGLVSVVSPPYSNVVDGSGEGPGSAGAPHGSNRYGGPSGQLKGYGTASGQIGRLRDRGLSAVVSPPYDNRLSDADERAFMDAEGQHARPATSYGQDAAQIGNLAAVTSPPHGQTVHGWGGAGIQAPASAGQIGVMDEGIEDKAGHRFNRVAGVTSPPYEDSVSNDSQRQASSGGLLQPMNEGDGQTYGATSGQISSAGHYGAETYATAMLQVYREAALVCSSLAVVTKNPTRTGKLHRLDRITARLLRAAGWQIVDYHRAILFSETQQGDMFDSPKRRVRGRLSFFKRLSLNKGQPVAAWEDVLFCKRASGVQP